MKWYAGAILLLLAALALQLGLLAYAMYVLLALLVVSRILARLWIENLSASRECNRLSAEIGEKVAVVLTLRNQGKAPVPWVLAEDLLPRQALAQRPPRIKVKGKRLKISMLGGHGQTSFYYQIQPRMRGYYQLGPLILESGDLFGLHRRYRVATEPHYLLVYPQVIPLEGYDISSRRPIGEVRMCHRLYEDPTRIAGVRLYQPGDALNRVHWRATARTGLLHSKIYEPSTIAGASLLLDFHQAGYTKRGEPYRSELAVTTAASLANAVYQLGQQVGLATNGRDAADRIRLEGWESTDTGDHPYFKSRKAARQAGGQELESHRLRPLVVDTRRGPEQLKRILETLARVELTDGLTFAQLATEAASRLPRDATVVALLPDVPEETALALGNLRRRGFAVTAVLVLVDENHAPTCVGRLLAEHIEVRQVKDEAGVASLCRQLLSR